MRFVLLLAVLVLTGCAFDTFDKALPMLKGEKIDVAIEYLGPPDREQKFGDKRFFTWERVLNTTINTPVTTQTRGYVGNTGVWGNSTTWQAEPVTYHCKVQLETDKNNIIKKWSYEGNDGGCRYYADSFAQYLQSKGVK